MDMLLLDLGTFNCVLQTNRTFVVIVVAIVDDVVVVAAVVVAGNVADACSCGCRRFCCCWC